MKINHFLNYLAFFLLNWSIPVHSQSVETVKFLNVEMELDSMFKRAQLEQDDQMKKQINDRIAVKLGQVLSDPASFKYPFDSLRGIGKVLSPDEKLRIISWNTVYSDITYHYYGFMQYKGRNKNDFYLYHMQDNTSLGKDASGKVFTPENWYGCLVYKILKNNTGEKEIYTLLETDLNDIMSGKKIIDVLWFDNSGNPFFGLPVFKTDKGILVNRVIFEYAAQAVMSLKWEPRVNMILYDHLSPIQPGMEGNYKFYGPDMSIDGFRFEKGVWNYVSNVDMQHP